MSTAQPAHYYSVRFSAPQNWRIKIYWTWHYSKQQNLYIFCNFYTITDGKSLGLHTYIIVIKYTDSHLSHAGQSQPASQPHTHAHTRSKQNLSLSIFSSLIILCACVCVRARCKRERYMSVIWLQWNSRVGRSQWRVRMSNMWEKCQWEKEKNKKTKDSKKSEKKEKSEHFSIFRTQHKIYESCSALLICTKLVCTHRHHLTI